MTNKVRKHLMNVLFSDEIVRDKFNKALYKELMSMRFDAANRFIKVRARLKEVHADDIDDYCLLLNILEDVIDENCSNKARVQILDINDIGGYAD